MQTRQMCRTASTTVIVASVLTILSSALLCPNPPPADFLQALSPVKPGPRAIDIQLWTNAGPDGRYHEGERLIVSIQVDRDAHLLLVSASSDGDVIVLHPNIDSPDTSFEKGKLSTFFGDDSAVRLTLGERVAKSVLACFVSSEPVHFKPLEFSAETGCITIKADDHKKRQELSTLLESMARDPGFNGRVVPLESAPEGNLRITVTRVSSGERGPKRLPGAIKSKVPGAVTGSQGVKMRKIE